MGKPCLGTGKGPYCIPSSSPITCHLVFICHGICKHKYTQYKSKLITRLEINYVHAYVSTCPHDQCQAPQMNVNLIDMIANLRTWWKTYKRKAWCKLAKWLVTTWHKVIDSYSFLARSLPNFIYLYSWEPNKLNVVQQHSWLHHHILTKCQN